MSGNQSVPMDSRGERTVRSEYRVSVGIDGNRPLPFRYPLRGVEQNPVQTTDRDVGDRQHLLASITDGPSRHGSGHVFLRKAVETREVTLFDELAILVPAVFTRGALIGSSTLG